MIIKRIRYFLVTVLFCSAMFISVSNTWKSASDFYGLMTLVAVPDEDRSYNPFSKNFFWISQDIAVSIITKQSYHFDRCARISKHLGSCEHPKIEYASTFVGMVDSETELKIFEIIESLIERKQPINAYNAEGFTALHTAILFNNPKLVSLLLESGADPHFPIKQEGKLNGKSAVEFVELLASKNPKGFSELRAFFYDKE